MEETSRRVVLRPRVGRASSRDSQKRLAVLLSAAAAARVRARRRAARHQAPAVRMRVVSWPPRSRRRHTAAAAAASAAGEAAALRVDRFCDATLEQPIDGELQGLNRRSSSRVKASCSDCARGAARERRRVRRLQHRRGGLRAARRQAPSAFVVAPHSRRQDAADAVGAARAARHLWD